MEQCLILLPLSLISVSLDGLLLHTHSSFQAFVLGIPHEISCFRISFRISFLQKAFPDHLAGVAPSTPSPSRAVGAECGPQTRSMSITWERFVLFGLVWKCSPTPHHRPAAVKSAF